jgi:hypothetical protein
MALTPTPAQPTYGFMNWFLNTDRKLWPSAPATAFAHLGNGTNLVYVDPEHDLVVVAGGSTTTPWTLPRPRARGRGRGARGESLGTGGWRAAGGRRATPRPGRADAHVRGHSATARRQIATPPHGPQRRRDPAAYPKRRLASAHRPRTAPRGAADSCAAVPASL